MTLTYALLDRSLPCPDQLFLIAPALDWSNSVPGCAKHARFDPWLNTDFIYKTGQLWSQGESKSGYCSPIFGNLSQLAKADVKVTLCAGTYDLLYASALEWAKRSEEANLSCTFVSAERCVHVYPLLAFHLPSFLVPESHRAISMMIATTKRYSRKM